MFVVYAGIEPETKLEELPDDWICPECGAIKDQFVVKRFTDSSIMHL